MPLDYAAMKTNKPASWWAWAGFGVVCFVCGFWACALLELAQFVVYKFK